jgi:predicted DNA-binding protein with PD1-like motif
MKSVRLDAGNVFYGRLSRGADLLEEVMAMARDNGVSAGFFTVVGAVEDAVVGFYRPDARDYAKSVFNEPLEVSSCTGNIALKDGGLFLHAHACLSRRDGSTVGGHLFSARVFAGEVFLFGFRSMPGRVFDGDTGLFLVDV